MSGAGRHRGDRRGHRRPREPEDPHPPGHHRRVPGPGADGFGRDDARSGEAGPGLRGHRLPVLPRPGVAARRDHRRPVAQPCRGAPAGRVVPRSGRAGRVRVRVPPPGRALLCRSGTGHDLGDHHPARARRDPPGHPVRADRGRACPVRACTRGRRCPFRRVRPAQARPRRGGQRRGAVHPHRSVRAQPGGRDSQRRTYRGRRHEGCLPRQIDHGAVNHDWRGPGRSRWSGRLPRCPSRRSRWPSQ